MKLLKPIDKNGKIRPISDPEYVGHPVVAYLVTLEDGHYVFYKDQCIRRDNISECISYVERQRG